MSLTRIFDAQMIILYMNFQQQHLICFFVTIFLYDVVTTVFGLGWFGLALGWVSFGFGCVGFVLGWLWLGFAVA